MFVYLENYASQRIDYKSLQLVHRYEINMIVIIKGLPKKIYILSCRI